MSATWQWMSREADIQKPLGSTDKQRTPEGLQRAPQGLRSCQRIRAVRPSRYTPSPMHYLITFVASMSCHREGGGAAALNPATSSTVRDYKACLPAILGLGLTRRITFEKLAVREAESNLASDSAIGHTFLPSHLAQVGNQRLIYIYIYIIPHVTYRARLHHMLDCSNWTGGITDGPEPEPFSGPQVAAPCFDFRGGARHLKTTYLPAMT